ncbi:MAG: thiol-disulfide isomerase/thioredoxin [Polaribacter sp.]|jgi:thiol-disulfide isomerase/thioredoxin
MMKKLFTLFFVLGAISFVSAQTTYWAETFNDGLPTDWTLENVGGTDWIFGTPADVSSQFYAAPANADGGVACFNDDLIGSGDANNGRLTSNAIDLTAAPAAGLIVEMKTNFLNIDYQGADETAIVSISNDDGVTWTELASLGASVGYEVPSWDISSYAGSTILLAFVYDDGNEWNYGWTIDEVRISDAITLIDARSYRIHAGSSVIMDDAIVGTSYHNNGYVVNYGLETITSFDVTLSNGADSYTQSYDNVNIALNGVARYAHDQEVIVEGDVEWTVTISNVNGSMDDDVDLSDNSMSFNLNAVDNAHPDKAVLVEEATGTWCPWCTRGTAYLEEVSKRVGKHFVGIAVHNGDPMTLSAYDGSMDVGGYPSAIYQRDEEMDPSAIVPDVMNDIQDAPEATVRVGASIDGDELTTSIHITFMEEMDDADHNISIVLIEDGMTGTGNDWAQANAYAGGGNGPMGGYELWGSPVPANEMVYDHVGRALIGGFDGQNEFTGAYAAGVTTDFIFEAYDIPSDMNMDNVHIVGLLLDSDGVVVNAFSSSVDEALAFGLTANKEVYDNNLATVFPNPVQNSTRVSMSLEGAKEVSISVVNTMGQTVSANDYGSMSGTVQLDYDMSGLATGIYMMHIKAGDTIMTKKINKID